MATDRPLTRTAWDGRVVGLWIAPMAAAPMRAVSTVEAVAGRGLAGDRYADRSGTWSDYPDAEQQVTLIQAETLQVLARDHGIAAGTGALRRNVVTAGVPLAHLVGARFRVGPVILRGVKLCEPCAHLERLTGLRLRPALVHRGGLNAEILTGGLLRVGESVTLL